ncbi:hypothetical protein [Olivibacter sp. XZL3]|uniref:hypothetical protein n=1 Tax=Olivibacter sp. XZL3 TaxID=1735116 RepID=UPI001416FA84|nr:hypothetical protein [Olivibacter sp. XZL3]
MPYIILILAGVFATAFTILVQKLYVIISQSGVTVTQLFTFLLIKRRNGEANTRGENYRLKLGLLTCYLIGIFFVCCYYLLWKIGVGKPDVITALLFGIAHGLLSIFLAKICLKRGLISNGITTHFYISLLLAHLAFALTAVLSHNLVTQLLRIGEIQP